MLYHGTFYGGVAIIRPVSARADRQGLLGSKMPSPPPSSTINPPPSSPPPWPRIIRLIQLYSKPTDHGPGDTVNRWITERFKTGKCSPKNGKFLSRIATGCACASRVEVLNRKYPFRDAPPTGSNQIKPD